MWSYLQIVTLGSRLYQFHQTVGNISLTCGNIRVIVSPGYLAQVALQLFKQHPVAKSLLRGAERMDVCEVGETGQNVGLKGLLRK